MRSWLLVLALAGCNDGEAPHMDIDLCGATCRPDLDLSMEVPTDLATPDLAPWCVTSGPAPTCQGVSCAPGCTCTTDNFTGPDGGFVARCDCSSPPPASPSTGPHSGVYCCGGMFCAWQVGWNANCSADHDCHAGP